MKKNLEKIFTSASVVVAVILIMVLLVTAFGGIKQEDFDNNLVKGLLFTLGVLYLVLSIVAIVLIFVNSDVIKDVTLRTDKGGSIKVSASVINKYVRSACSEIEGVKCKKVGLVSDEYGVRLKANIKVVDKDVIEVETYLRTLLEDMFLKEFDFKFNSIEFKVTALVPKYKADKAEIENAVAKKLEELRAKEGENSAEAEDAQVEENAEPLEDAPVEEPIEAASEEPALEEPLEEPVEEPAPEEPVEVEEEK
ncbi:MAG: hypothetical protein IK048_05420 [Clostridia bacterium]|nr:hypothetical protein [Clostridia bacterium]